MKSIKISKDRFLGVFEELNGLLRHTREPDGCFFVTDVSIRDISGKQVEVSFYAEYGPVATRLSNGDVDAEMLECKFKYLYNTSGSFIKEQISIPKDNYDLKPSYSYWPGVDDIPDHSYDGHDLIGVVSRLINGCKVKGKPINSIQFRTASPAMSYSYTPGVPSYLGDDGSPEEFDGSAVGVSLSDIMQDDYNYCCTLTKSKSQEGEWDLVFWVNKK